MLKILLSCAYDWSIKRECRRKIHAIAKHLDVTDRSYNNRDYIAKWSILSNKISTIWRAVYEHVSGYDSIDYIPEDLYYADVEPVLNYRPMSSAETCKSLYDRVYADYHFPECLLKNENGVLYNKLGVEFKRPDNVPMAPGDLGMSKAVIVKPSLDSGGGYGVRRFILDSNGKYVNDEEVLTVRYLTNLYGRDFVVQRAISQNDYFAAFNSSSVNTLRVFTYRSVADNSINILHTLLRVGRPGSITDNQASGGMSVGVRTGGILNNFAVDKKGNKTEILNGLPLRDVAPIPEINRFHELARSFASELKYSRLLGLDLAMKDNGEIVILEVNNKNNEINFYQMNNGPLFGDFTQEVIDYCSKASKSYCFDYSL